LISNSQSGPSNGFSMDSASMGWMVVGMGRFCGASVEFACDAVDVAEEVVLAFSGFATAATF
jgi:hypothetical protein